MADSDLLSIESRYQRAQEILQGLGSSQLVQNDAIFPYWIEGTDCFWYERITKLNKESSADINKEPSAVLKECRLVDAKSAINQAAFDHQALTTALSHSSGQHIDKDSFPLKNIEIKLSPLMISFDAFEQRWLYNAQSKKCHATEPLAKTDESPSPNGKATAFVRDFNLWVRDKDRDKEWALTSDGIENYSYGGPNTAWGTACFIEGPVIWSNDSNRLITVLRDKRQVLTSPYINDLPSNGSLKPKVQTVKVAYSGDNTVETYQFVAINMANGKMCIADYMPLPSGLSNNTGLFFSRLVWWANDNRLAYFIAQERGDRVVRLVEFNTDTGNTRVLFEETSDTHINIITSDQLCAPCHRFLPETCELIWWSECSGWGHLYLYDLQSGELKHPITLKNPATGLPNEWLVRDVLHVDAQRREIIIQTAGRVAGRNPYYRDICRVNIDSGEIITLFSGDEDAMVHYAEIYLPPFKTQSVSENGDYIVMTRSRVDQAPVTELINRQGETLLELEATDTTSLLAGWTWPESVQVLAADGVTPLNGVLYRPSHFDPNQSYPLINYVGSGPWMSMIPVGSFHSARTGYHNWHYFNAAALAELGFMVLQLDSRGTPLRSKAFQDYSYGWVPDAISSEDHTAALQQLSERYPAIDPERIGSYCAAYPGGLTNFLECQDLYKVHVQSLVFDVRLLTCSMKSDIWESVAGPDKDKRYPEQLVKNLRRKLLIMHPLFGPMADIYPLTSALRVVHALQKANKDFDMLMTPNTGPSSGHYSTRRIWDYFVKHLMNSETPKAFDLKASILP
ncbi:S9 family peptidase [Porticoccaceae bacterium]|nr:S9 family peptidase [Porticoccaceae bacterium]